MSNMKRIRTMKLEDVLNDMERKQTMKQEDVLPFIEQILHLHVKDFCDKKTLKKEFDFRFFSDLHCSLSFRKQMDGVRLQLTYSHLQHTYKLGGTIELKSASAVFLTRSCFSGLIVRPTDITGDGCTIYNVGLAMEPSPIEAVDGTPMVTNGSIIDLEVPLKDEYFIYFRIEVRRVRE